MKMKKVLQKKRCLSLKTFAVAVLMALFAMPAMAQTHNVNMGNGNTTVPTSGEILFYDSGGPDLVDPDNDIDDVNWMSWYQHNEDYKMTFVPADNSKGIKFHFEYLRVNNDYIRFYEGNTVSDANLIAEFSNEAYLNNPDAVDVISHGTVTVWFKADTRYRDRGWFAHVTLVNYAPTPPAVMMMACDNQFRILPTAKGNSQSDPTKIYYTIGQNNTTPANPTNSSTEYILGEDEVYIDAENMTFPVTVKAITYVDGVASSVTTQRFASKITPPAFATNYYTHHPTTNTIDVETRKPEGVMDTYYVRYIFSANSDPGDPAYWSETNYKEIVNPGGTIDYTNAGISARPFYVHMLIRGTTCPENFSVVQTVTIEEIYAPKPEIAFGTSVDTIKCNLADADIYYTTDGSDPTDTSDHQTVQAMTGDDDEVLYYYILINHVSPGVTVKAQTRKNGYENSDIAMAIYSEGSNVYPSSGLVLLDDREDHSWVYYSDSQSPIHNLKPADVKITYMGYGPNTMTSTSTANMPANSDFNADVEADQVAVNVGEPGNQFIYLKTLENANEAGTGNYPYTMIHNPFQVRPVYEEGGSGGGSAPETYTVYLAWSASNRRIVTYSYVDAAGTTVNSGNLTESGNITVTVKANTTITLTARRTNSGTNAATITAYYNDANGQQIVQASTTSQTGVTQSAVVDGSGSGSSSSTDYRGFYAWRVKSLGGGLTISGKSVGDIIYPDETIEFVTSNAEGNEVEFEALWAKAYVNSTSYFSNSGNYKNAYERNFKTTFANYSYPVTFTTLNPDGSGSMGSMSPGSISCSADYKFENMTLSANGLQGNNHSLHIGRGVSNGNNNVVNRISGYELSNNSVAANSFTFRIESGRYNGAYLFYRGSSSSVTTANATWNMIVGSDYDRAKNDNNKLVIAGAVEVSYYVGCTQASSRINVVTMSGTLGTSGTAKELYVGYDNAQTNGLAYRNVEILGGVYLGGVSGGISSGPATSTEVLKMRIKGGTFSQYVYGAGQYAAAYGTRKMIITGGIFNCWVAGGCYGTNNSGGETDGNTYVYFGGDASMSNTVGVFGSGYGTGNTGNGYYTVAKSYVVAADEAQIAGSVYGGGNNGYCTDDTEVYVKGTTLNIAGSVYGGANLSRSEGDVTVTVKSGKIVGSVYGGAWGNTATTNIVYVTGKATVNVEGGTMENVYGGGLGAQTRMNGGTEVNVSGGTINNNVYGGGQLGSVYGNTAVNISGGTINDVYGAGLGTASTTASANANISQNTNVTVTGGEMQNVFGGGENGSVAYTNGGAPTYASTVTISGGTVKVNVYGGGSKGFSQANTFVNIQGGSVEGDVFGGALGTRSKVYVGGVRTVNMTGGTVAGSVYGGSRNADDALRLTNYQQTTYYSQAANRVNITGGHIVYQVFAAGFFGNTYGSVYAFIGKKAVTTAPNHMTLDNTYNETFFTPRAALYIEENVWAGGDFGSFDGTTFGTETVEGYSHIYVDGEGYDTETNNVSASNYMSIGKSLFGCGTSCYAGKLGRNIYVRNYGKAVENPSYSKDAIVEPYTMATRSFYSIQFANNLVFDNTNVNLLGQGRINSLVATETYSLYNFPDSVNVANASGLFLYAPADQIKKFGSYTCPDVYATNPAYTVVNYSDLPSEGMDNKIRVNNGSYINVYYTDAYGSGKSFGELEGFFYMMTEDQNITCAYARPKTGGYNDWTGNVNDGGFVSYSAKYNIFNVGGVEVQSGGIQMAYENHTSNANAKSGEEYFRIWRYGGIYSYREGVLNAVGKTAAGYSTASCTISLPASEGTGSYYVIKSELGFTTINYGSDVLTVNGGCYDENTGGSTWMYYTGGDEGNYVMGQDSTQTNIKQALGYINLNTNANFGLIAVPQGAFATSNENWLICEEADVYNAANSHWSIGNTTQNPAVEFVLTYNNHITANMSWDPITITVQQYMPSGDSTILVDEVEIQLTVKTTTTIDQLFTTQVYATMRGEGTKFDSYTAKVVLPEYTLFIDETGSPSTWTYKSYQWVPEPEFANTDFVSGTDYYHEGQPASNHEFSMTMAPAENFDYTMGWDHWVSDAKDIKTLGTDYEFGYVLARNPFAFDFTIHYNGEATCTDRAKIGTLKVTLHFTNYKPTGASQGQDVDKTIEIEVYRVGVGLNWFLDGVNGDHFFSGHYPNAAKKTLARILTDPDYMPGDNIFIVNTVTNNSGTLDWNGESKGGITIYRYPGGHDPETSTDPKIAYQGWDEYNPNNEAFQGTLLQVNSDVIMHGITLDGAYYIVHETELDPKVNALNHMLVPDSTKYLDPMYPLINVASGANLTVYGNSVMQWNVSTADSIAGGAVYNAGKMYFYDGSVIQNNAAVNSNGGGVYLAEGGQLQLSDMVTIYDNWMDVPEVEITSTDTLVSGTANNVYLEKTDSEVLVGTANTLDLYISLNDASKIGVTKGEWGPYYYTPVAYADGGLEDYLQNILDHKIIVDDQELFEVLSLNNTHYEVPTDHLYFVGTWVTAVRTEPEGFERDNIDTPEELAWAISVSTGYNHQVADSVANFVLTGDIDMNRYIWVPIGSKDVPYRGVFEGNGHVVTGLRSPLNEENMGMFGTTEGATIGDFVARTKFVGGTMKNIGAVIGSMNGGTLTNVEAAGTLTGNKNTVNMGGLVGQTLGSPVIHSCFAVDTLNGGTNTVMGGLIGDNVADLYNSYSNTTISGGSTIGGLVGDNKGHVENCYNITNVQYVFAGANTGEIKYCYAVDGTSSSNYVGSGNTPNAHGTYGTVKGRKELGYMYEDNKVTKVGSESNPYITPNDTLYYTGGKIEKWRGLLSTLNQWVEKMNGENSSLPNLKPFTSWYRSTSSYLTEVDSVSTVKAYINGDLPVLGFPKDNSMGTLDSDGKFLRYGSNVDMNGIDTLVGYYNVNPAASSIFLYGIATDVENAPLEHVKAFINEDAVLLQKAQTSRDGEASYKPFTATVGITFDNSCRNAYDYYYNKLNYDWHMMATPLSDASLGAVYKDEADHGWDSYIDIQSMTDGYFPNGLPDSLNHAPRWDFYNYYEPEYHWINLKRNKNNHYHFDPINYVHERINYNEADQATGKFTLGKGYMMAVEKDSYMSSNGTLNNDNVTIKLTAKAPTETEYNRGWNLVGNPYMAYLDLQALYNAQLNPNISEAYVYDADLKVYTPFVQNASSNPTIIQRYVHAHQAFFVKYMRGEGDPDNMDLVFKPEMATATEGTYFRDDDDQVNYPLVNLFAENAVGNRDLAVIEFHRPELGGATKMNGLRNANFQIFARMNDNNYGLLFTPEGTERVPVWFTTEEDGVFTLSWNTLHGNFTSLRLIDNLTGVNYDMLANDSYTFEAKTSDYASRFYITFTCTDIDEYLDGDDNFAFFDGSEWIINGKGNLEVVDVLGRVLFAERLYNDQNRINLNGYAKGVYLIRISDNKNTRVQKIVVR